MQIDLALIFGQLFGSRFNPDVKPVTGIVKGNRTEYGTAAGARLYGIDAVSGVEYYLPATLEWKEPNVTGLRQLDLPHPLVSVTASKNIIETQLTERRGTVKELINANDLQITIRGVIIGKTNEFPEEVVTQLWELYSQNVAMTLKNGLTDIFLINSDTQGYDKVVIKSLTFPEIRGVKHVKGYEMQLVSDVPFSLTQSR